MSIARRLLWAATLVLASVGVAASAARVTFMDDLISRVEPVRVWTFEALGVRDATGVDRAAVARDLDAKFSSRRATTLVHVIPGALFLGLVPFQFWLAFRRRQMRLHRWTGRVLVLAGIASAGPAFYFGVIIPFGGLPEAVLIAAASAGFVFSLVRAWLAIRGKDVEAHREWMLRAFALAAAISTVRIIAPAVDATLSAAGYVVQTAFVATLWLGWLITVGGAEVWIRRTRAARTR